MKQSKVPGQFCETLPTCFSPWPSPLQSFLDRENFLYWALRSVLKVQTLLDIRPSFLSSEPKRKVAHIKEFCDIRFIFGKNLFLGSERGGGLKTPFFRARKRCFIFPKKYEKYNAFRSAQFSTIDTLNTQILTVVLFQTLIIS